MALPGGVDGIEVAQRRSLLVPVAARVPILASPPERGASRCVIKIRLPDAQVSAVLRADGSVTA